MNNTQSPPAWTSPSPPPGCTHSEQSTMLLQLPPSKPHAPTNRTVHTYPRYTQTYPNKLTRLYIQTPSHYRQTDKQTDRQTARQPGIQSHIQEHPCLLQYTVLHPPLCKSNSNSKCTVYSAQAVPSNYTSTMLPTRLCMCMCMYICLSVCLSVCQSVCQSVHGWVGEWNNDWLFEEINEQVDVS